MAFLTLRTAVLAALLVALVAAPRPAAAAPRELLGACSGAALVPPAGACNSALPGDGDFANPCSSCTCGPNESCIVGLVRKGSETCLSYGECVKDTGSTTGQTGSTSQCDADCPGYSLTSACATKVCATGKTCIEKVCSTKGGVEKFCGYAGAKCVFA